VSAGHAPRDAGPEELRPVVRDFVAVRAPLAAARSRIADDSGYDPHLWKALSTELGLPGLTVPEQYGGAGLSCVELAVVLEELARSLVMTPYLSVALGVEAIVLSGDVELAEQLLPAVATGELTLGVALTGDSGYWSADRVDVTAVPEGSGWRLDGSLSAVVDGGAVDRLIVAAGAPDGLGLFVVAVAGPGVQVVRRSGLDLTREMASVHLTSAPASRVVPDRPTLDVVQDLRDRSLVAYVAELAGVAGRCLEMATAYALTREQFGRPIGSFQAVKQKAADMLVSTESIQAAMWSVSRLAAEGSPELRLSAAVAKAYSSDRCYRVAADNIQIHGGIGYTWEHDAHLYFRRAKALQLLGGDASQHRVWIARQIGL
jgi:alkylation response protein AidB-like acyl-CoA dehydrogenase